MVVRFGDFLSALAAGLAIVAQPAAADVVISTGATSNMTCANGVCTPTSSDAVLNVSDLESMLASSNVDLAAADEPVDVDIDAVLSWTSANALTLDSYHSIRVNDPVAVSGGGGLSLVTNDGSSGGAFSFAPGASVSFSDLASSLSINGVSYTLVDDIKTLAADISSAPGGSYALAGNYDASRDGVYSVAPVNTSFMGNFQGLGNTISNITITNASKGSDLNIGLFGYTEVGSSISNLKIQNAMVSSVNGTVGILVGLNQGTVFGDHTSGEVVGSGGGSAAGGLVGFDSGSLSESSSSAAVSGTNRVTVGGLLGDGHNDAVDTCFATGQVTDEEDTSTGGLIGYGEGAQVTNSYAMGSAKGGKKRYADAGGFMGYFQGGAISNSYSTGAVIGGKSGVSGGFLGVYFDGSASDSYWDKTTSGKKRGVGNGPISGITGLSSKTLKSQLPSGFDPSIWAEDKGVNHGFPYLIANPPQ